MTEIEKKYLIYHYSQHLIKIMQDNLIFKSLLNKRFIYDKKQSIKIRKSNS